MSEQDRPYRTQVPSPIHGVGVFATRLIHKGELVHIPTVPPFSGFNHSCDPNLGERIQPNIKIRPALHDIHEGEELTVNYSGGYGIPYHTQCQCPVHQKGKILYWITKWLSKLKFWR